MTELKKLGVKNWKIIVAADLSSFNPKLFEMTEF